MDNSQIEGAFAAFGAQLKALQDRVAVLEGNQPQPVPVELPQPASTSPYEFDANGLITKPAPTFMGGPQGPRIEPVVGTDCPGVVVTKRGHALFKPVPKEGAIGYVGRVMNQCRPGGGAVYGATGGLFLGASQQLAPYGFQNDNPDTWPEAADGWWNSQSTPDTKDYGTPGTGTYPVTELKPDDLVYVREAQGRYTLAKQNGDLWRDAFAGNSYQINVAKGKADIDRVQRNLDVKPEVAAAVKNAFAKVGINFGA